MFGKQHSTIQLWTIVILLLWAGLVTGCRSTEEDTTTPQELRTWLLVRPPEVPLPVNQAVTVRSRTQDPQAVSHVELYLVELQRENGDILKDVLIRSDAAPFPQTTFTASQTFTPLQPGHYVIKVRGYNAEGKFEDSDFIGFDVMEGQ